MIKASATSESGERLLIFGFSERNLELLRSGNAMAIELDEMGLPGVRVLITYGETEGHLKAAMAEFIGPQTRIVDRTKGH